MTAKRLSAASYRAMGEQSPIEFECEDGSVVKIPRPTAGVMFDVEESQRLGTAGPRDILRMVCGDAGEEIVAAVRDWPLDGVNAFTQDLMEQLGMGESDASSG